MRFKIRQFFMNGYQWHNGTYRNLGQDPRTGSYHSLFVIDGKEIPVVSMAPETHNERRADEAEALREAGYDPASLTTKLVQI